MLQASNRGSKNKLEQDSLRNIPVNDLHTINRLWIKYSGGMFGFSIQKKIWKECGSPRHCGIPGSSFGKSDPNWINFGERIGWKRAQGWLNPSQLTHNHIGELPALWAFICYGFSPHAGCDSAAILIRELPDLTA
jgi:GUN4-like